MYHDVMNLNLSIANMLTQVILHCGRLYYALQDVQLPSGLYPLAASCTLHCRYDHQKQLWTLPDVLQRRQPYPLQIQAMPTEDLIALVPAGHFLLNTMLQLLPVTFRNEVTESPNCGKGRSRNIHVCRWFHHELRKPKVNQTLSEAISCLPCMLWLLLPTLWLTQYNFSLG